MTDLTLPTETFSTILLVCIYGGVFIGATFAGLWYEIRFRRGIKSQLEREEEKEKTT